MLVDGVHDFDGTPSELLSEAPENEVLVGPLDNLANALLAVLHTLLGYLPVQPVVVVLHWVYHVTLVEQVRLQHVVGLLTCFFLQRGESLLL